MVFLGKKSIPVATISASLEVESLSGGLEIDSAVLYLVPNLRTLLSYYFSDELIDFESLVLVDGSTELVNMESLLELNEMGVPIHVFTGSISRSRFVNNLAQRGFTTFKWSHKLVEHFLLDIGRSTKNIGIESWERQIKRDLSPPVEATAVDSDAAAKIYESFREIDRYTKEAEMENDRHVDDCFRSIKGLTLSLLKLNLNCESDASFKEETLASLPTKIEEIRDDRSLDEKQQGLLIKHLEVVIKNIEMALKDKAVAFHGISFEGFYNNLISSYPSGHYRSFDQISKERIGGACLSGIWPGQKILARLLNRGLDLHIRFVLFAHEYVWFQAFLRNYYSTPTSNSVYRPLEVISELADDFEFRDDDLMDSNNHLSSFRSRVVSRTYDDEHFAHATSIFYLDPDAIIFATERSEFSVLTGSELDLKLSLKYGSEVREGDRLVYLPNTERDAIREIADRMFLGEGVRAKATRWRTDLIAYYKSQDSSFEDIRDNLEAEGVKRGVETIRQWIADDSRIVPSKPREAIPAIYNAISHAVSDQELLEIFEAAEQVLSAHFKAADYLSEKVRSQLERGANSLQDAEDVRIYEVTIIESCNDEVPYRILSRPQAVEAFDG